MGFQPKVLLVEPNEIEENRARQAITQSGVACTVWVARDGVEACNRLFDKSESLPDIVLLELNLPKLDGFEVLRQIRANERTRRIPVIVLTQSGEVADVDRCFDLYANSYVQKDKDLEIFETRLRLLLYYWIAVNKNVSA